MQSAGRIREHAKGQEVLIASFVLAVISMLLVPPSADYLDYIDFRTLCILLSMMAVIAAIANTGALEDLASRLLSRSGGMASVCAVLILVPTVLSMFITNDVSLLTFVPFAFLVLGRAGRMDLAIPIAVLQTVGANLGSMLLPFGNPQNIFLSSKYEVPLTDFLSVTGPVVLVGAVVLFMLMRLTCRDGPCSDTGEERERIDVRRLLLMVAVMVLCMAAVLRVVPYQPVTVIALIVVALASPKAFKRVDWGLLLTFVFLFVFAGNISNIGTVREALEGLMSWDPLVSSALVSQAVSNVPAAVMLSNFTDDWQGLLAGVDIGGFGTPIASMASVITLRLYTGTEGADIRRYLVFFTAVNVLMLAILLVTGILLRGQRRFFFASGL